jgi:hypothetical protein
MTHYIELRDRKFRVITASIRRASALWQVEIETESREFDEEIWTPRLYHQGLRLPASTSEGLAGISASWGRSTDPGHPHPELGLMYVFGHHEVYDATLAFGRLDDGRIELAWDGMCDVYWSGDFDEAVPFRCRCLASMDPA